MGWRKMKENHVAFSNSRYFLASIYCGTVSYLKKIFQIEGALQECTTCMVVCSGKIIALWCCYANSMSHFNQFAPFKMM